MKYSVLITYLLFNVAISAQTDTSTFNSYFILSTHNEIIIVDANGIIIFSKLFHNPYQYLADIDDDQFDELVIVDSIFNDTKLSFSIYLFNGEKEFELIDSIYSGSFFPFLSYSDEIGAIIVETGNSAFEKFNTLNESESLPVNIWCVKNDVLLNVNDEVYEPFIFENSNLLHLLDYYSHEKGFNCLTTEYFKGIIASAFANYINAGEQSLAGNLLKKYYLCEDIENFRQEIIKLIFPEAGE